MGRIRYTEERLREAVSRSVSYTEVAKSFGIRPTGGSINNIIKRVRSFGIDTSHFPGKSWNKGRKFHPKRTWEEILVCNDKDARREKGSTLRRALMEAGVPYVCRKCGTSGEWMGNPLILEVHHTDGNSWNNSRDNLEFMCPNCHSQTDNYAGKSNYLPR